MIWLVGAGPGDPGLLTVRGQELLGLAEVVVHDALVSDAVLARARPSARLISVGKRSRVRGDEGRLATKTSRSTSAPTQDEIHELLAGLDATHPGGVIVRLKGGDPYLFGRGGEEAFFLARRGIAFGVVPGISSALAAPAAAGIPVTHRGASSCVTVITGTGAAELSMPDPAVLARLGGTIVVLMGAARAASIARDLAASGLDPRTPVAAVRWATWPDEESWTSTIGDLPSRLAAEPLAPPVVLVIGSSVALGDRIGGRPRPRVLVAMGESGAGPVARELAARGAVVVEAPAFQLRDLDPGPLDEALGEPRRWTDLVLTSRRAARVLGSRVRALGLDGRALAPWRITAIGSGTAAELDSSTGLRPDAIAEDSRAEGVVAALGKIGARRFLLPRALEARDHLERELGASLTVIPVYESIPIDWTLPARRVIAGEVDAVIVGSASSARTVIEAAGREGTWPAGVRLVALGPVTAGACADLGVPATIAASPRPADLARAALGLSGPIPGESAPVETN